MDETSRRAARRRATIAFVVAGVLVVVSAVGLLAVERRHDRWDGRWGGPGTRIERHVGDIGPGAWDGSTGNAGGERDGQQRRQGQNGPGQGGDDQGGSSRGGSGSGGRTEGGPGQSQRGDRPAPAPTDGGQSGQRPDGGQSSSTTTTTAPVADGI